MNEPTATIRKRQKLTDVFRSLKIGQEIQVEASHYETPHSTARLVGIKVETKVISGNSKDGFFLIVKRVVNRSKKKGNK